MVTPSSPVPPPRRDGRRFVIPTPADLRHPRERRAETDDDGEATGTGAAGDAASTGSDGADAAHPGSGPGNGGGPDDGATTAQQPRAAGGGSGATAEPASPLLADPSPPMRPTPATLPRPGRPAAPSATTVTAPPQAGAQPEPATEPAPPPRRMFPNPATLMAAGRGARKARPGGLRARRLPKVEETSAGGVVLDLSSTPPAVALIARHDRRSRLLWSLPKGHVEEGETPEQAALREVFEETGLVGRIVAPLGVIDFWFVVEDKRIHKTVHHFVIEAIGGELSDEDLEVEAVEWIPYDQVVRRLAYGDERRLVEKVAQIVPGVR